MKQVKFVMCGFIGCVHEEAQSYSNEQINQFKKMNDIITHRGPNDEGFFYDEHVQFGFRRLSIIDLDNGHQPLSYENERYWIIFNGEVYNYIEIRDDLIKQGLSFETETDTEVVIALYSLEKEKAVKNFAACFHLSYGINKKKHYLVQEIRLELNRFSIVWTVTGCFLALKRKVF